MIFKFFVGLFLRLQNDLIDFDRFDLNTDFTIVFWHDLCKAEAFVWSNVKVNG